MPPPSSPRPWEHSWSLAQLSGALKSGKPELIKALAADPRLPDGLKQALAKIPAEAFQNPQTVEGFLAQARQTMAAMKPAILEQARNQALEKALA